MICQGYIEILSVSYTHLRANETVLDLVCRLLLEKKKKHYLLHASFLHRPLLFHYLLSLFHYCTTYKHRT
ncbi:hypothetical protein PVA38_11795 [Streptococcus pneumoniae D39]|nr:hypothetical protein PVA38_11795 [Streptococcus pneumoniae D39]